MRSAPRAGPMSAHRPSSTTSETARTRTTLRSYAVKPWLADGSARGGFPDVEAAPAQRGLGAVDLGLRDQVAGRQRGDLQPLAGDPQQVEVGAADRAQLDALRLHVGPGLQSL